MPWDNTENGGFSGGQPWIPLSSRVHEINLENDRKSEKSVFRFYQALLALRRENPAFLRGKFTNLSKESDTYFMYERTLGSDSFTVICNFENDSVISGDGVSGTLVLSNYADAVEGSRAFRPYEIAVYRKN